MKVTVLLTNDFDDNDPHIDLSNRVCLVIDVIRATSTITAALGSGAEKVIISPSKDDAFKIKDYSKDVILCGEDKGLKIKGFDYDNSPLQLSRLDLSCKSAVIKTTNGTMSFIKARNAKNTFTLSILNLYYSINCALNFAIENHADILFLCSGILGMLSYDDAFVAGLGIKYLIEKGNDFELDDNAELVLNAASNEKDIFKAIMKSRSAKYALTLGLEDDIKFSSLLNKYNITGKMEIDNSNNELGTLFIIKPYYNH